MNNDNQHKTYKEYNEYVCVKCGCRWSVNDRNPPKCITKKEYGLKMIRTLRDRYDLY